MVGSEPVKNLQALTLSLDFPTMLNCLFPLCHITFPPPPLRLHSGWSSKPGFCPLGGILCREHSPLSSAVLWPPSCQFSLDSSPALQRGAREAEKRDRATPAAPHVRGPGTWFRSAGWKRQLELCKDSWLA